MRSRPEIFVSLIVVVVAVAGLLGYCVVRHSQAEAPKVSEQNRIYEAAHRPQASKGLDGQDVSGYKANSSQQEKLAIADQTDGSSVKIYFSKNPDSSSDPSVVASVSRVVTTEPIATASVKELIAGPSDSEKAKGLAGGIEFSGASNCGSDDFILTITNDKAQLQFCRQHVSGGALQDAREQAQISRTLEQFSKNENIVILDQAGNCLFTTTGQNLCKQ